MLKRKFTVRSKAALSAEQAALPLHRKLVSANASSSFGSGKTTLRAFFQIRGQSSTADFLHFFLGPTEASARTLIFVHHGVNCSATRAPFYGRSNVEQTPPKIQRS
jgi:hypothetical protein